MTEHPAIPEQAINAGAAAIRDGTAVKRILGLARYEELVQEQAP